MMRGLRSVNLFKTNIWWW